MATGILGIADLVQPQIQLCTLCLQIHLQLLLLT